MGLTWYCLDVSMHLLSHNIDHHVEYLAHILVFGCFLKIHWFHEKDLFTVRLYLANAAWQLNLKNGTDLSLITNNKEEIHPNAQEYINHVCGEQFVKHMKCAVWDWGQRFDGISEHIKEVTEYFHSFHPADLPPLIRKHVYPNCKL